MSLYHTLGSGQGVKTPLGFVSNFSFSEIYADQVAHEKVLNSEFRICEEPSTETERNTEFYHSSKDSKGV
jgi:hypothetical protein